MHAKPRAFLDPFPNGCISINTYLDIQGREGWGEGGVKSGDIHIPDARQMQILLLLLRYCIVMRAQVLCREVLSRLTQMSMPWSLWRFVRVYGRSSILSPRPVHSNTGWTTELHQKPCGECGSCHGRPPLVASIWWLFYFFFNYT